MGRKSKYEEHFELSKEKGTCKRCGEVVKMPGRATTGLQFHLSSQHNIKINAQNTTTGASNSLPNAPNDISEAGPAPKKSKIDEKSGPMNRYVTVTSKIPLEDLVAREAVKGATFRFIASSQLIYKGLCALGFQDQAPRSHVAVSRLVDKSAENHRAKLCEHLKSLVEEGQKFCVVTDEWTCSGKKKRYINVTLHIKGNFCHLFFIAKLQ